MTPRRLFVSFSGGETSAYMLWYILTHMRAEYDEIVIVFANTGCEWEETLEFVRDVGEWLGVTIIWVEAVVPPEKGKGIGFKIVDFKSASRNGEPFAAMIEKYGIPNGKRMHCTRDLKLYPMEAFTRSLGWGTDYDRAIGIRADEIDRMSINAAARRIIYPLVKRRPMTKPKINFWWSVQPFRLRLKGYQGNCKWCWKKSFRKLFTIMREAPEVFTFPMVMEILYGRRGAEFEKDPSARNRVFFRGEKSVLDLEIEYGSLDDSFIPADDENQVFDPDLDVGGACEESCEVYADEDMVA